MVFVLLVALGSDYNIFLMHRIREEAETPADADAVRIASGHTGAVITSAGLILAGTFGSMATAPLTILFQVGVAVAIGVLIDTFLVRSILVPAITTLVGDRAWWPSGAAVAGRPGPRVPAPRLARPRSPWRLAGLAAPRRSRGARPARHDRPGGSAPPRAWSMGLALAVLVPLTVAGLLTWSFGSAPDNLGAVRAAVVNLDQGGVRARARRDAAAPLARRRPRRALTTPGTDDGFTWVEADAADAETGLANGAVRGGAHDPGRTSPAPWRRSGPTRPAPPRRRRLRLVTDDGSGYALGTVARPWRPRSPRPPPRTSPPPTWTTSCSPSPTPSATVSRAAGTPATSPTSSGTSPTTHPGSASSPASWSTACSS